MKETKKFLSVLMALMMIISIIPMSIIPASAAVSGTCGTNLTWNYDSDTQTLTISGTGAMSNYSGTSPWNSYKNSIKNLIIEENVTTIGRYAFFSCSALVNVTIPNSVTAINDGAFSYCKSLIDIKIPDGVTTLGIKAFYYSDKLENVSIGKGLATIGENAFEECYQLKNITVDKDNQYYSSDEYNVLYNKDKTTVVRYPQANERTSYSVPDGVTTIGENAFYHCYNLKDIVLPDSIVVISDSAFNDCRALEEIYISDNVKTIGDYAFEECYNLKNFKLGSNVETIGVWAFELCRNITSIEIPDSVTSIGEYAFYRTSITTATIGSGLTYLGANAFTGCYHLANITVDENNQFFSSDEYGVLYDKDKLVLIKYPEKITSTSYIIPNSVSTIKYNAFEDCSNLTNIIMSNSLKTIEDEAFSGCNNLKSITIPEGVTKIGEYVFVGCDSITSVKIPDSVTKLGGRTFMSCDSLTSAKIGKGIKTIPCEMFSYCTALKEVVIPDTITTIEYSAFEQCTELTDVYYYGTQEQWNNIDIDNLNQFNTPLFVATIHYNYVDPDRFTGIKDDYFYIDGKRQKAYQLFDFEGNFYYTSDGHKLAKDKRIYLNAEQVAGFTYADGTPLVAGYYNFDADGKMVIMNGPVGDYFYENNVRVRAYNLVEFEGNFYYTSDGHKLAKDKRVYLTAEQIEDFTYADGTPLVAGYYTFDADGKMVIMNGPVGDYFYENNVRVRAYNLVEYEGNFYYTSDGHKLAKDKRVYLTAEQVAGFTYADGTPLVAGYYNFDANGKMVIMNGPVGDYFYENNVRVRAYNLVEFEGNFYYTSDGHKLAKDKRIYLNAEQVAGFTYADGTPLSVGYYTFDADGKMVIQ